MKYSYRPMESKNRQSEIRSDKEEIFIQEFDKAMRDGHNGVSFRKGKRFRSAFTTEQVNYLEDEFRKYPYVGICRRKDVANILKIPERAVKIWFQNRRMKEKKDQSSKEQEINMKGVEEDGIKKLNTPSMVRKDYNLISLSLMPSSEVGDDTQNSTKKFATNSLKPLSPTPNLIKTTNNYHNDITPETDLVTISKVNSVPTVIKTNPTPVSKCSAEFSIELLKKYKTEKSGCEIDNENKFKTDEDTTHCQLRRSLLNEVTPKMENQPSSSRFSPYSPPIPQDLSSCKRENMLYPQQTSNLQQTNLVTNSTNVPVYFKGFHPQPYMPPGNMIWKPVNVAPIMSTGLSMPMTIANSPVVPGPMGQPIMSKRNCNCDCHLKPYTPILMQQNNPAPPMQYVITAVPYHNHLPKF